ncbi:MAG: ABC transporter permease [Microbacteriaceae bacterium]
MTTIPAPVATGSHVIADSVTMLRRTLLHMVRYPGLSAFTIGGPIVFLLLFVFVFGGTLGAGLPGVDAGAGKAAYFAYVVPGILAMTVAGSASGAAITVSMDMIEGITARFRSMAISRAAVLAGHVLGNAIVGLIAVALVLGVALLAGFRSTTGPVEWLLAAGFIAVLAFALNWLGVGMGMQAKSVETASNLPLILTFLPMLGSGFVPTASMPEWLQVFAQYQPFTPIIETIRGLLLGTPIGAQGWIALAWCGVIALGGYVWARAIYNRKSVKA